jgi:PAS domain S-box-containing protein
MVQANNENITPRLMLGFLALILLFFLFGVYALYDIHKISKLSRTIYNHPLVVSNAALQANVSIAKMHRSMKDVVLFNSLSKIQKSIETVNKEEEQVYRQLNTIKNKILGEKGMALERDARQLFTEWRPIRNEVIGLVKNDQRENAADITIGKGADYVILLETRMYRLTQYARNKAFEFNRETENIQSKLRLSLIVFLVLGIFTSLLVAYFSLKATLSAEKKLLRSKDRYRSLIEDQIDFVCRITADGKFIFVNDMYCQFFNKSKKELIGSEWQLLIDEDIGIIKEKLSQLSFTNPIIIIENRVISGKGNIHWIQFINRGFFDDQENLLEIQSVGRDITERKLSEEKLKAAEANLKNTFDISPSIISKMNLDTGYFIEVSPIVTRILGYSAEEFTSRPLMEFVHKDDRQRTIDEITGQLQGKQTTSFENRYLCKDGSYKWISWQSTTFDKKMIVTAVGSDITENKKAEKTLQESEEKLQLIIETSPVGICTVDPLGNFVTTNLAYEQMVGYSKEELRGLSFFDVTHPDDRPDNRRLFREMFSLQTSGFSIEKRYIHKDGTMIEVAVHASGVMDAEGRTKFGTAFIEDITDKKKAEAERKSLEQQSRQAQKMESVGQLAGGVAHEINNPINGIMNYAQLIKDKIGEENPLSEYTSEIIHETERVSKIVKNLLVFARQDRESHSPAKLKDIIDDTMSLIQTVIKRDQITLIADISDDLPKIKCRSQQIQQVVMNLVTNARDALNEKYPGFNDNKKIEITSASVKKDGRQWIRTTVEDRGIGISFDTVERVFDPFYTTKERFRGTGLGLSISYGIVKDHKGELTVESEPGQYTRFHMDLPV